MQLLGSKDPGGPDGIQALWLGCSPCSNDCLPSFVPSYEFFQAFHCFNALILSGGLFLGFEI